MDVANLGRVPMQMKLGLAEPEGSTPSLDWNSTSRDCASLASRWSSKMHLHAAGADVPVEVAAATDGYFQGSVEAHETITMPFGVFLEQIDDDWRRRKSQLHLHLAQCPLALFPSLHTEAAAPQCITEAAAGDVQSNLWFCLSSGHSALHYDCFDGLLMVLRGVKHVLLLPPSATSALRPRAAHTLSANRSSLSRKELDDAIAGLETSGHVWRFEVRAGHTLRIPEGWWHAVDSPEEVTLAVNYWWAPRLHQHPVGHRPYVLRGAFARAAQEEARRVLYGLAGLSPPNEAADAGAAAGHAANPACGGWCDDVTTPTKNTEGFQASAVGDATATSDASFAHDAGVAKLATTLLDAAELADVDVITPDAPALLRQLLEAPAPALCRAMAHSAMHDPAKLRVWFTHCLGRAAAHALGLRLQEAQGATCAGCAAQAARDVETALSVLGDEATVAMHRKSLLLLAKAFADEAASHVLRDVLGVEELATALVREEYGGERKRVPPLGTVSFTCGEGSGGERKRVRCSTVSCSSAPAPVAVAAVPAAASST